MQNEFAGIVERIVSLAPKLWLEGACGVLLNLPANAPCKAALKQIPQTNNADLSHLFHELAELASRRMSWEAMAWTLKTAQALQGSWQAKQDIELLWGGPAPPIAVPARRIDQALYDLIAGATLEITLVTFAAAKIQRLATALLTAAERGVAVCLILEFEHSSEGQLSFDALRAFPPSLVAASKVYHWPLEKRERNQLGRPGKLHAKVAIIDDTVLVSSANLTDDAFSRNIECGVLVKSPDFLRSTRGYLEELRGRGVLVRV
jgi:cardiolipin synthase